MTRHRDKAAVFVARNRAKDVKELARQMGRTDDRRAASMFELKYESASVLDPACTNRINDLARRSASGPQAE
jgi:hypothetical protein